MTIAEFAIKMTTLAMNSGYFGNSLNSPDERDFYINYYKAMKNVHSFDNGAILNLTYNAAVAGMINFDPNTIRDFMEDVYRRSI